MCQCKITLAMDISLLMMDYDEIDRLYENAILDDYELTDLPHEVLDGSSPEESSLGSASIMIQTVRWGWHPEKGVIRNCTWELTLARCLPCLSAVLILINLIICSVY